MTITQQPYNINLSGNLKPIRVSTVSPINFKLSVDGSDILTETYQPSSGMVEIEIKNIINSYLIHSLPNLSLFSLVSDTAVKTFTADISGTTINFTVIKGGVADLAGTDQEFLKANFLTWRPAEKTIKVNQPEWLSYYTVEACLLKIRTYVKGSDPQVHNLGNLSAGKLYDFNMSFAKISEKVGYQPEAYDVWVENSSGVDFSYTQRYIISNQESKFDNIFLWENLVGGFDTIIFSGNEKEELKKKHESISIQNSSSELKTNFTEEFTQSTGLLSEYESKWLRSFFLTSSRFFVTPAGVIKKIVGIKTKSGKDNSDNKIVKEFTYKLSKQSEYQQLDRTELSSTFFLPDPSTFFKLEPRLVDLTDYTNRDDIIIASQDPFSSVFGKVNLHNYIERHLTGRFDSYFTKTELSTPGHSQIDWNNLKDIPSNLASVVSDGVVDAYSKIQMDVFLANKADKAVVNALTTKVDEIYPDYVSKSKDAIIEANTIWASGYQISAQKAVLGGLVHENNMIAFGTDKIGYSTAKNAFVINDKKIAGIENNSILNGAVRWDGSKLVTIADTVAYKDKSNIFTQVNTFNNLVNINTATGNLQIGSTNSGWVHFLSNNNLYSDKAWHAKNGFTVYNTNNKLIDTGLHSNYANITTYLTAADATVTNTLTGNIINAATYSATDKVKSNILNPHSGNLVNINSSLKVFDNSIGVANSIGTEDYISGLTGRGWRVDNSGYLGVGDIYARGSLTVSTFINQKIAISNGDLIVSDSKKIMLYTSQYADNIYFKKGENPFKIGNVLRCKTQSKDYKITVIQVTDSTAYPEYEYCKFNNKTGTGNIETDDFLVRWSGGLLFLSSSSPDSPYYDVVYNGITQARFGNTSGINSPEWGQLSGYSIWADGAYFDNVHVSGIIKVKAGSNVYDKTTTDSNISTAKSEASSDATAKANAAQSAAIASANSYSDAAETRAVNAANGYTNLLKGDLKALAYKETLNASDTTFIVGGKLTNSYIDTNYVKTAILTATNIKALNLEVGNHIQMGADAYIAWDKVTGTSGVETTTGAQAKIDSLEIGGVNLVLDSDTTRSSTNYLIHRYTLSENWKIGQRYTVTIKGTINSGQRFGVWNDTGYDTLVYLTYNSDKGVWIGTGVVNYVRDNEERYASVYNVSSESAVTATIEWIKIEHGDKSTGWTPSPNDVRLLTNNAQTKANSAYTLANSKVNELQATLITQNTVSTSYVEGLSCNFKSGSVGNFSVNDKILWSGAVSPVNTSGDVLRVSSENIGAGLAYNGSQILQGYSLTWHRASNAGHIVLGQMMEHSSTIKLGYKGIQMMDHLSREYFALGAKTDLSGSMSVYNRIAGCSFDSQSVWAGTGWRWNKDGSGYLGNGNVSWDTGGNVNLSSSVKMSWDNIDITTQNKINSTGQKIDWFKYNCEVDENGNVSKISGGTAWNGSIYSRSSYGGGCVVSFTATQIGKEFMIGLNSDPSTNQSYETIDYALYCVTDGRLYFYENGAGGYITMYEIGDTLSIVYDNKSIFYKKNGTIIRTVSTTEGRVFHVDSSFAHLGSDMVSNITFQPLQHTSQGITSITQNAINTGTINFNNAYGTNVNLSGHINAVTANIGGFTSDNNKFTSANSKTVINGSTGYIEFRNSQGIGVQFYDYDISGSYTDVAGLNYSNRNLNLFTHSDKSISLSSGALKAVCADTDFTVTDFKIKTHSSDILYLTSTSASLFGYNLATKNGSYIDLGSNVRVYHRGLKSDYVGNSGSYYMPSGYSTYYLTGGTVTIYLPSTSSYNDGDIIHVISADNGDKIFGSTSGRYLATGSTNRPRLNDTADSVAFKKYGNYWYCIGGFYNL